MSAPRWFTQTDEERSEILFEPYPWQEHRGEWGRWGRRCEHCADRIPARLCWNCLVYECIDCDCDQSEHRKWLHRRAKEYFDNQNQEVPVIDLALPDVVMVGGKKRSGKDFLCDSLAPFGFEKVHIAEGWLRRWMADHDENPNLWKELMPQYRAVIQRDATVARETDPFVVVRETLDIIQAKHAEGKKVAVSGVRFTNEVLWGVTQGYLVIKVWVTDRLRRQRFVEAGEDLALFDDPFEREIDKMQWPLELEGNYTAGAYPVLVSAGFVGLHQHRAEGFREAA